MKSRAFALRNTKELLRDPLSYIFCLGLPVVMLLVMTLVNQNIPKEAQVTIFHIASLAPAICVFSFMFVMLFACLLVSKDRCGPFLVRLYASPMTAFDYVWGYGLPLLAVALGQFVVTFAVSAVIAATAGEPFAFGGMLLCAVSLIPSAVLFIGVGILFGSLFSEKMAPPLTSVIITAASVLGGIWMDVDLLGGGLKAVCAALPFYHGVRAARLALAQDEAGALVPFVVTCVFAAVLFAAAALVFRHKMKSDTN